MLKLDDDGTRQHYALAVATTEMMWACAIATARATVASTAHGLDLWSQMMRSPVTLQTPAASAGPSAPVAEGTPEAVREAAPRPIPADPAQAGETFATYRSAGGHAAAQVIVSN